MSTEFVNGEYVPQWHLNADDELCWFRDGIPSINGNCAWCGKPSKGHRPVQPPAARMPTPEEK